MKKIVIALGGNALEKKGLPPTADSQLMVVRQSASYIADIINDGCEVIISHGNGPQIGRILLASENSSALTPAMPFDVCGAMSQGYIGYHLQQALQYEMKKRNIDKPVATIITQVVVDKNDAAFQNPSKPIGPFYSAEEAAVIAREKGYFMKEDAGRGWRRVVPSPLPAGIAEIKPIKTLLDNGCVVIACGGGGVPVIDDHNMQTGAAAVIDKDFASEKLAEELGADTLMILTEVENVSLNFKQPNEIKLNSLTSKEMKGYVAEGHFAAGSMLPKVLAAIKFADSGNGRTAIISSLNLAKEALEARAGTRIVNTNEV